MSEEEQMIRKICDNCKKDFDLKDMCDCVDCGKSMCKPCAKIIPCDDGLKKKQREDELKLEQFYDLMDSSRISFVIPKTEDRLVWRDGMTVLGELTRKDERK